MNSREEREHERIGNILRNHAASVPVNPDPYGAVMNRVHAARRRTALTIGGVTAAVAALAVGVTAMVRPTVATMPGAGRTVPLRTGSNPAPLSQWPISFAPKPDPAIVGPLVDQMIARYGKPVDGAGRAELVDIVGAFQACVPALDAYRFEILWTGDTFSMSDGHGAAVVEVVHGGVSYQIVGYRGYKGNVILDPVAVPSAEATRLDIATYEFSDITQQVYVAVWTTPGATVSMAATERTPEVTATADARGLAELDVGNQIDVSPWNTWWPSAPISAADASGHTRQVRKAVAGDADLSILPAGSACRS